MKQTLITLLALLSISCSRVDLESDASYAAFTDGYGVIIAVNPENEPIDFFRYDPSFEYDIREIRVSLSKEHPRIGFLFVGSHIDAALDKDYMYLKSAYDEDSASDAYATFLIQGGKIAGFEGNGFGTANLKKTHMDYVLSNIDNEKFSHTLQVVVGIVIETITAADEERNIIVYHNLATDDVSIWESWTNEYGGVDASRISWDSAKPEWKTWRDEYLKGEDLL